jgi:NADH dehydrogenase FAD-containing subunit
MTTDTHQHPLSVLIAGGGVAALEAMMALRAIAGDRVRITLLAPERDFHYRPMAVAEPFTIAHARRVELATSAQTSSPGRSRPSTARTAASSPAPARGLASTRW